MGTNKFDTLGDRMKGYYEDRTRFFIPRRTYTIIRIDGKAFHTYTRGLEKPFDIKFIEDMDETACYLCKNIQGSKFAFVQSDEISILLTDFDNISTNAYFDGNIQKIASVSSSLATAKFNQLRILRESYNVPVMEDPCINSCEIENFKLATFDARVFTIPQFEEVKNYFVWRQQDTVRNSISSVAQALYSSKELHGKNTNQMQEMCFQKGVNWNDLEPKLKRGRFIKNTEFDLNGAVRTKWESVECPIFSQDKEFLNNYIPNGN